MREICIIYNFAQHYRKNIFSIMDKELNCDFVFGDRMSDVRKLDYKILSNFKKEVKNITFGCKPLYYQLGVLPLLTDKYSKYLLLGELHCVSTWLFLFFAKFSKKRVFLWSHGWYGRESRSKRILKKMFFSMADGIFLYGNYAKELMQSEGFDGKKLHVIYNSLDYEQQVILRDGLVNSRIYSDRFNNRYRNLVFVGRLTSIKKLNLLLEALRILKLDKNYFNLTLIGSGEEERELMMITKEYGLEQNVWFYGSCYDEAILSILLYNADMCVSPGNVGLTAIHSMTYGTPVITHNNFPYQMPEFEAIEDGVTGVFFNYDDPESLAESITRWFNISPKRELIHQKCFEVIDRKYNPYFQIEVFKSLLLR